MTTQTRITGGTAPIAINPNTTPTFGFRHLICAAQLDQTSTCALDPGTATSPLILYDSSTASGHQGYGGYLYALEAIPRGPNTIPLLLNMYIQFPAASTAGGTSTASNWYATGSVWLPACVDPVSGQSTPLGSGIPTSGQLPTIPTPTQMSSGQILNSATTIPTPIVATGNGGLFPIAVGANTPYAVPSGSLVYPLDLVPALFKKNVATNPQNGNARIFPLPHDGITIGIAYAPFTALTSGQYVTGHNIIAYGKEEV